MKDSLTLLQPKEQDKVLIDFSFRTFKKRIDDIIECHFTDRINKTEQKYALKSKVLQIIAWKKIFWNVF